MTKSRPKPRPRPVMPTGGSGNQAAYPKGKSGGTRKGTRK